MLVTLRSSIKQYLKRLFGAAVERSAVVLNRGSMKKQ